MTYCALCGSDNIIKVSPPIRIEYLQCKQCGFERQDISGESVSARFKESQRFYYENDNLHFSPFVRAMNRRKSKIRLKIVQKYLKEGSLLEIGSGMGEFLVEARSAGFDVEAIEASHRFADYIRNTLGVKVFKGTLEDFNHQKKSFDGLYSSHVFEHVVDPINHLALSMSTVRKGGYLFISTPNSDCWEHKIARKRWAMYTTAHLRLFSPKSLSICLQKAGWEVVEIKTYEYAEDWLRALVSLLLGSNKNSTIPVAGGRIKKFPPWLSFIIVKVSNFVLWPLCFLQASLKKGNDLFVVARRAVN